MDGLGVVAIGRNEGNRLIRCLESLQTHLPHTVPIVYVDSGSTDNSVDEAKQRHICVVNLDMSVPFTGARARNAGFTRLMATHPHLQYVQFIDGDCELLAGWMEQAVDTLRSNPALAVVFGQLQERFPKASAYNHLAQLEWTVPVGEAKTCGGIALIRAIALKKVGGYNPKLICGEEPELCIRLRRQDWKIRCIATAMAIHDIDMYRFSQWWTRSTRNGWAIAQGADMYGNTPERYRVKEHISGWLWGAALPAGALLTTGISRGMTLLALMAIYLLQLFKIYRYRQRRGDHASDAFIYALFCVISKVPQAIGQGKYWRHKWQNKPAQLIEYKSQA